jgi:hypothetical protein
VSGSTALYRLLDALGRAWVVPSARQVSPDEMLTILADPTFDPTSEVLLETTPPPIRESAHLPIDSSFHSLSLQDTFNGVTIHVSLDAPGYLVLADTWYPGWQATVDGEQVEVLRANYAFRAVPLDEGEHVVEMAYAPLSVRVGAVVSLGMLIVIAAGVVWLTRRQRISGLR